MATEINIVNDDTDHQTYVVSFFDDQIHTTVTRWINEIERPNLYIAGLSIHFHDSEDDFKITSIELCVGGRCLIYQLDIIGNDEDYPEVFLDFIYNGEYTFAGVFFWDFNTLDDHQGLDIPEEYVVDLRLLTADRCCGWTGLRDFPFLGAGLRDLGEMVLGKGLVDLPEDATLSWWDLRQLTSEQVKLASVEVFISFNLGRILDAREYRINRIRP